MNEYLIYGDIKRPDVANGAMSVNIISDKTKRRNEAHYILCICK